jgi:hypothetical protein
LLRIGRRDAKDFLEPPYPKLKRSRGGGGSFQA